MKRFPWLAVLLLIGMLALVDGAIRKRKVSNDLNSGAILMLVPDGNGDKTPASSIWLDAAQEEGVAMHTITMSELLERDDKADAGNALVLPDSLIRRAPASVVQRVAHFSHQGGRLMVVNDALLELGDQRQPGSAPLAEVVGLKYGASVRSIATDQPVFITESTRVALRIPPGKTIALDSPPASALLGNQNAALAGYQYGVMRYPVLPTEGQFPGEVLLADLQGDVVSGWRPASTAGGDVLFVNLPLGFLKGRTDGLLLHVFLHFFAFDICKLPVMSVAPDDVGRLVFNWHIDSNAADVVLAELTKYHLSSGGPYSIDVTAGPDVDTKGDGRGLDLAHNTPVQEVLRALQKEGDEIGSHGGWIHNYFGKTLDAAPTEEMRQDLEKNVAAITAVTGVAPREYSAPLGNQPVWVTDWLEQHNFVAYYFTGNTDMAPTRSYRDGVLHNRRIWSFPILIDGAIASFEEAEESKVSPEDLQRWLNGITDFVADQGTIRTFYSHPHSFPSYETALEHWLQHIDGLEQQHRFAFITMPQAAAFMDARLATRWTLSHESGELRLTAENTLTLAHQAWRWPAACGVPHIVEGNASIAPLGADYRIVAGPGTHLIVAGSKH